jgi:hypothetical protein
VRAIRLMWVFFKCVPFPAVFCLVSFATAMPPDQIMQQIKNAVLHWNVACRGLGPEAM